LGPNHGIIDITFFITEFIFVTFDFLLNYLRISKKHKRKPHIFSNVGFVNNLNNPLWIIFMKNLISYFLLTY